MFGVVQLIGGTKNKFWLAGLCVPPMLWYAKIFSEDLMYRFPLINCVPSNVIYSPAFNVIAGFEFPLTKINVFVLCAMSKTRSSSLVPMPFIKIYSFPVFSKGTIWSNPTSLPIAVPLLFNIASTTLPDTWLETPVVPKV